MLALNWNHLILWTLWWPVRQTIFKIIMPKWWLNKFIITHDPYSILIYIMLRSHIIRYELWASGLSNRHGLVMVRYRFLNLLFLLLLKRRYMLNLISDWRLVNVGFKNFRFHSKKISTLFYLCLMSIKVNLVLLPAGPSKKKIFKHKALQ